MSHRPTQEFPAPRKASEHGPGHGWGRGAEQRGARAAGACMRTGIVLVAVIAGCVSARAAGPETPDPLDAGFARMYELQFPAARQVFAGYIQQHPNDPMGQVSLAASYLFEEFNEHGVFTSSFFLNNRKLLGGIPGTQRDGLQSKFLEADSRARQMAEKLLKANPNNPKGLFVITLADGMEADYDALIAKRDLTSLLMLREAQRSARLLLKVNPGAADAYLALGAANYIIGCMPSYQRFFLGVAGIHGSRTLGMRQLQLAAMHGHYLKPFAEVMLALTKLREKQPAAARELFSDLHARFPENQVFATELAKLQ